MKQYANLNNLLCLSLMRALKKLLIFILSYCYATAVGGVSVSIHHKDLNFSSPHSSPITTLTPDTMDKGSWGLSLRSEYYRSYSLSDATLLANSGSESQTGYLLNYIILGYGVTNQFYVGAALPMMYGANIRTAGIIENSIGLAPINLGDVSGVADTSLLGLWRILNESDNKLKLEMALTSGIAFPTGKTHVKTKQGTLFALIDQPGTGGFSPFAGIVFSREWENLILNSDLIYNSLNTRSQNTQLGDIVDYDFAMVYPLLEKTRYTLNGVLELNGEYTAPEVISNIKDPNSGSNIISLTPGLRVDFAKNISCYLGFSIPIIQTINGTQSKSQYNIYTGIDMAF